MTLEALGNLGEFIGAVAVVVTLIYLSIQVRHSRALIEANSVATAESAKFARAAAMDRYNDAVSRWRGRLIENEDVAALWDRALRGESLEGVDTVRFENLWIDWINTYRTNFRRAAAVADEGLQRQAVMSVVLGQQDAPIFADFWEWARPFNEAGSADFVAAVDAALASPRAELPPYPLNSEDDRRTS